MKEKKLRNSKILIGVTGGIAIYKAADLIRRLTVDHGAEVQVVMTPSAQQFMTPLIFETLTGKPVYTDMFKGDYVGTRHIDLAKDPDLVLICPATGNILAKAAQGIADDLLSSTILAAWEKLMFAPAMNVKMWENPSTQKNMEILQTRGFPVIQPKSGLLACNDIGTGKLADIDVIIEAIYTHLKGKKRLAGKKVLVTGGPTRERIDSVRFISNYSTGKMGLALAQEAQKEGADTTLITGPVNLDIPVNLKHLQVESAAEMLTTLSKQEKKIDYLFMSAAIEDFIPVNTSDDKIKKDQMPNSIPVKQAPDIVSDFRKAHSETCIIGFSVESAQGKENSLAKMARKGLDYIVWNDPQNEGAAFAHDTNEVTLFSKSGQEWFLPKRSKRGIAENIIKIISDYRTK
ncbi:MAG: bifunctional phosphopantothenoylcysteine decarboxylase/phosphopantothenate--cysteine ligase CoaBC [Fidelibacterota bacterium]